MGLCGSNDEPAEEEYLRSEGLQSPFPYASPFYSGGEGGSTLYGESMSSRGHSYYARRTRPSSLPISQFSVAYPRTLPLAHHSHRSRGLYQPHYRKQNPHKRIIEWRAQVERAWEKEMAKLADLQYPLPKSPQSLLPHGSYSGSNINPGYPRQYALRSVS